MKKYFPKELLHLLDLDSLEKADTSYIDEELEAFYTDALYKCKIKGERKIQIYVSLLFEHKSYIPKFPHLQLLQYVLNGLNQQAKEKQRKLTLILPFVIAHANRKWKVKPFWEYFDLPNKDFIKFIPNFEYLLTDLFQETDESIEEMAAGMLVSTFLLFKHRGDEEYLKIASEKVFVYWKAYRDTETGRMFTHAISRYIHTNFPIEKEGLQEIIEHVPEPLKSDIMMLKERLLLEGQIKGQKEGELRRELAVILRLIKMNPQMADKDIAIIAGATIKRVADARKEWNGFKTNFQKVSFLNVSFPNWEVHKIADFGNIPIEEMDAILEKIKAKNK